MLTNHTISAPILINDLGMLYSSEKSKSKKRFGLFLCHCGKEFKCSTQDIKNKRILSCGCYRRKLITEKNKTHGLTNHRLFTIWVNILDRTQNEKNPAFKNYGGRCISVCEEWKNDFTSFYHWSISSGYKDSLTIDRIDNEKGYNPSNCRWATKTVQARNTRLLRSDNTSGYRGVYLNKKSNKWRAQIGIKNKLIYMGEYSTPRDAAIAYNSYVIENNLEHTMNIPDFPSSKSLEFTDKKE